MAAPIVSGAAALLLQENPNLTPGMVKAILEYSAQPIANTDMFRQGADSSTSTVRYAFHAFCVMT
jgi:subtilisin family serine protease